MMIYRTGEKIKYWRAKKLFYGTLSFIMLPSKISSAPYGNTSQNSLYSYDNT